MTFYIGVDLHPHQQTVAWCNTETGETQTKDLKHDPEEVREFYSSLPEPAISRHRGFDAGYLVREHAL
jgi:hypothetical protein